MQCSELGEFVSLPGKKEEIKIKGAGTNQPHYFRRSANANASKSCSLCRAILFLQSSFAPAE